MQLSKQGMLIQLTIYILLLRESIEVVLGLNPSDSNVSYASFLAPVNTALICSRVKTVLVGHGLESQVLFIDLAYYIVLMRKYFSGLGFESL